MPRTMPKDEHWARRRPSLLELNIYDKGNLRQTVEGTLYRMRIGCPWRDLLTYFDKPNTVYKVDQRWFRSNKLIALFTLLIKDSDLEWVFIDGTHIKAHQHSSFLSDGTTHDVKVAPDLIDKMDLSATDVLCADKGYDSDAL